MDCGLTYLTRSESNFDEDKGYPRTHNQRLPVNPTPSCDTIFDCHQLLDQVCCPTTDRKRAACGRMGQSTLNTLMTTG
jgi:hypothetical protein